MCTGLLDLLYPPLCIACDRRTFDAQNLFCMDCQAQLHPTGMQHLQENEFTRKFAGRIPIAHGAALFYYLKGSRLQLAIERLKYKNEPEIGIALGNYFGQLLKPIPHYQQLDFIVPVPLHPSKKVQRGYNQAAMIARGLAESLSLNVHENILQRIRQTNSQVNKGRMERLDNMQSAFAIKSTKNLQSAHVLLVDDILTTGATLEACAMQLLSAFDCKISMATIGYAG